MSFDLVIGAGPLGLAVLKQLQGKGRSVKLATRSGTAPAPSLPCLRLNLLESTATTDELQGVRTLFICSAPAYGRWSQELVPMIEGALTLAQRCGATIVFADNLYAYGPSEAPLTETTPYRASGPKGLARRAAAERLLAAHAAGKVRAAIVRASDFFGPGVERSILGLGAFRSVKAGKPVSCLGNPQLLHTLTFIEDFARAMVNVSETPECFGEVWHAPSAAARSLQSMVELIARECASVPRLRPAPHWLFRVMGLFVPAMRELGEVYYQYTQPWIMDSSKYQRRFGDAPTSHEQAIHLTLDTLRAHVPAASVGGAKA